MAVGPGKYDDLCTMVRVQSKAKAAVIMVISGQYGSGFSVQAEGGLAIANLPDLLRTMAKDIEQSLAEA